MLIGIGLLVTRYHLGVGNATDTRAGHRRELGGDGGEAQGHHEAATSQAQVTTIAIAIGNVVSAPRQDREDSYTCSHRYSSCPANKHGIAIAPLQEVLDRTSVLLQHLVLFLHLGERLEFTCEPRVVGKRQDSGDIAAAVAVVRRRPDRDQRLSVHPHTIRSGVGVKSRAQISASSQ